MKNIYFAAAFAVLAFSACSNDNNDDDPSSNSTGGSPSSSSIIDSSTPSSSSIGSSNPSSNSAGGSDDSGVCYFPNTWENASIDYELGLCIEGKTESLTRSDCLEMGEDEDLTVRFLASCPLGYKLKCGKGENPYYLYAYLYGEVITEMNITCSTFDFDTVINNISSSSIGGSNPSSSSAGISNPSSSSAGSSTPSSDSNTDSGYGACFINASFFQVCMEGITNPMTRSECEEIGDEFGFSVSFGNSCPTGHQLRCEEYDDEYDEAYVSYYYGDMFEGLTCDDLE